MSDAEMRGPGRGSNGTNLLLVLLVVVVLGLVAWLVMNRDESADVDVNLPEVEAPDAPDVQVEVKETGK
jgi:hypothetical protein